MEYRVNFHPTRTRCRIIILYERFFAFACRFRATQIRACACMCARIEYYNNYYNNIIFRFDKTFIRTHTVVFARSNNRAPVPVVYYT